jgi:hypothetical protein
LLPTTLVQTVTNIITDLDNEIQNILALFPNSTPSSSLISKLFQAFQSFIKTLDDIAALLPTGPFGWLLDGLGKVLALLSNIGAPTNVAPPVAAPPPPPPGPGLAAVRGPLSAYAAQYAQQLTAPQARAALQKLPPPPQS